jgi:hypothetical protein
MRHRPFVQALLVGLVIGRARDMGIAPPRMIPPVSAVIRSRFHFSPTEVFFLREIVFVVASELPRRWQQACAAVVGCFFPRINKTAPANSAKLVRKFYPVSRLKGAVGVLNLSNR